MAHTILQSLTMGRWLIMAERMFIVGDRVRFIADVNEDDGVGDVRCGDTGTVISTDDYDTESQGLLVDFDGKSITAVDASYTILEG